MERTTAHSLILGFTILLSFTFSSFVDKGKIDLKVSKEKDGEKFIKIASKRTNNLYVPSSEIQTDNAAFEDQNYSTKDNLKPSELNYYPNPNKGRFSVEFTLPNEDEVVVKLIDILGNEVYKEKIRDFKGAYRNQIDLTGKKKGIYILQISQKKKVLTRKILIE